VSVLIPDAQELLNIALDALPKILTTPQVEMLAAAAREMALAKAQISKWQAETFIKQADGIWLDQAAVDRATRRQNGESDAVLANRLPIPPDVVTYPALLAGIQAILNAAGVTSPLGALVELRAGAARMGTHGTATSVSFFNRGYRMEERQSTLIVILPYTTPASVAEAVSEFMRLNKAGGIVVFIETRRIP
jgi:hypothetical protein